MRWRTFEHYAMKHAQASQLANQAWVERVSRYLSKLGQTDTTANLVVEPAADPGTHQSPMDQYEARHEARQ